MTTYWQSNTLIRLDLNWILKKSKNLKCQNAKISVFTTNLAINGNFALSQNPL